MRQMKNLVVFLGAAFLAVGLAACQAQATPTPGTPTPVAAKPATAVPATPAEPKAPPAAPATPAASKPNGELRIATPDFGGEVMDPGISNIRTGYVLQWEPLVGVDTKGDLSKDYGLARDWKVEHSSTNSVYTFFLRQGVKWQDGVEVTAEDVKFTQEYLTREGSLFDRAGQLKAIVDRVEVVDRYTVRFVTKSPYGYFLQVRSKLESPFVVLPKHLFPPEKPSGYYKTNPIGTGPYRFKEQVVGSHITWQALNYDHWLFRPKYERVTLQIVPEETTRIAMLKRGETDLTQVSRRIVPELEAAGLKVLGAKGGTMTMLWLHQTWEGYLADPRVREALSLAIDREQLLKFIFGGLGVVTGDAFYGRPSPGYQAMPLYPHDPEKARNLLREAFPKGIEINMYSMERTGLPEGPAITEAIASMWQKAFGDLIKIKIVPTDWGKHRAMMREKQLINGVAPAFTPQVPSWGGFWESVIKSTATLSVASDPKLDDLITRVLNAPDVEEMGKRQVEVARYVRNNHYILPLPQVDDVFGANPKMITEWEVGFHTAPNFYDLVVQGGAYRPK